jgi:hypothetical protein
MGLIKKMMLGYGKYAGPEFPLGHPQEPLKASPRMASRFVVTL